MSEIIKQKVLIIFGDAAETVDTMYPYFRLIEGGYEPILAAPEKRDYQMVMHQNKPGWTITKEWEGYSMPASIAFKDGTDNAEPVLLEPIMNVEVVTPEDYMGDVMGDINRRRGMPQGMEDSPAGKIIRAEVPLAEMFGYATDLRSMSQGRAVYSMEFFKYNSVPKNILDIITNKLT